MGTLKTRLSVSSKGSADTTSTGFAISCTDALTIQAPVTNLASGSVTNSGHDILIASSVSAITYIYVKYVSKAGGTPIMVISTVSGTQNVIDLGESEAIFIPVKAGVGLRVTSSDSNAITYEYGTWTKS
tara:strand:- start:325 stop:711 length:387 start_codon:yes stop_codon:yes gene_type:complete